jgi:hypothetical protein
MQTKLLHQWLTLTRSSRTKEGVLILLLMVDRNQTVSQRSKPSSRTALIGEQPNPWNLFQLQDATSRHRGAKHSRRYGLLGNISLLSLAYLLFNVRQPTHKVLSGHYDRQSPCSMCISYSQANNIPLCSKDINLYLELTYCIPPLLFRRRPPQSNYPLNSVLFKIKF